MDCSFIDIGAKAHLVTERSTFVDSDGQEKDQVQTLCRPGVLFRHLDPPIEQKSSEPDSMGPIALPDAPTCSSCQRALTAFLVTQSHHPATIFGARDQTILSVSSEDSDRAALQTSEAESIDQRTKRVRKERRAERRRALLRKFRLLR